MFCFVADPRLKPDPGPDHDYLDLTPDDGYEEIGKYVSGKKRRSDEHNYSPLEKTRRNAFPANTKPNQPSCKPANPSTGRVNAATADPPAYTTLDRQRAPKPDSSNPVPESGRSGRRYKDRGPRRTQDFYLNFQFRLSAFFDRRSHK